MPKYAFDAEKKVNKKGLTHSQPLQYCYNKKDFLLF